MEIIKAEKSGFCFGVQRAIEMAFTEAENTNRSGKLYTCGPLIHNKSVTSYLEKRGVANIDSLCEAEAGDTVIVRSHGEPKSFYDYANEHGINLIDTTCVFVSKIHSLVNKAHTEGRGIVIIGAKDHPEVTATNGWCEDSAIIIENSEEARASLDRIKDNSLVVCQTTFKNEVLKDILNVFDENNLKYELNNTICNATRERQESCEKLAKAVDMMVVIGDINSSNSKKLYEISLKFCKNSIFVQNADDFLLKDAHKYNKIGIIAGASTPEWIIKEVIASMSENVTKNEGTNPMMDYMDDIEKALRLPKPGEIINGKVEQVLDEAVIINMGCKKDGILRKDEVVLEEGQSLSDLFKEGDDVQAKVIKSDEGEGGILLSKKRLVAIENYNELEEAMESNTLISVKLTRVVNGGVIAAYKEVSGFIPMSHLSDKFVENPEELLGETVVVKVIRVDNKRNRAVFSRKLVLQDEKKKAVAEIWSNLNVGDIVEGKVMRFTDYGAFVDIGGVDGLLHISEISWGKLKHPQEVLKIGDIINVKILSLNEEKGKISLGLKQTQPEPWSLVGDKYVVGQTLQGTVVQIKEYGAFVELEAGLDGLVHISEIANKRVENVFDELKIGQVVEVKIMDIDTEKKRISLSIKATLPEEAVEETAEEPVEETAPEAVEEAPAEAPAEEATEA